jgi:hypothetical protein
VEAGERATVPPLRVRRRIARPPALRAGVDDVVVRSSDEVPPHDDLLVERHAAEQQELRAPRRGELQPARPVPRYSIVPTSSSSSSITTLPDSTSTAYSKSGPVAGITYRGQLAVVLPGRCQRLCRRRQRDPELRAVQHVRIRHRGVSSVSDAVAGSRRTTVLSPSGTSRPAKRSCTPGWRQRLDRNASDLASGRGCSWSNSTTEAACSRW